MSTNTPTHGDAFGMTFCILFRGFFSSSHWCPFLDFSLFFLARAANCAFLRLHTWCEHSWVCLCVEFFTIYGHCPIWSSQQAPLKQTRQASLSLLHNNGSQDFKRASGRPKGPQGRGTRPSHSSSGFFLLISQAASHKHVWISVRAHTRTSPHHMHT